MISLKADSLCRLMEQSSFYITVGAREVGILGDSQGSVINWAGGAVSSAITQNSELKI